jgi:hypothetical protein
MAIFTTLLLPPDIHRRGKAWPTVTHEIGLVIKEHALQAEHGQVPV